MIEWRTGDLFESGAEALVNPVNCVGVMGKGLALDFKNRFPSNFIAYQHACQTHYDSAFGGVAVGHMFVWWNDFKTGDNTPVQRPSGRPADQPRWVINFPTKRHWKDPSQLIDIDLGLIDFASTLKILGPASIAIPALGCGLGQLSWTDVKPRIVKALDEFPNLAAYIYEPH